MSEHEHTHQFSDEEYESLLEQFKWCTAVLSVLLERSGPVEIDNEELEKLDLRKARVLVRYDAEKELYTAERVDEDGV